MQSDPPVINPKHCKTLSALPYATLDIANKDILFALDIEGGRKAFFKGKYPAMTQLVSSLGRVLHGLRDILASQNEAQVMSAEHVATVDVQREQWANVVLLSLVTPLGVPYVFALPPELAGEIADALKSESVMSNPVGRA